MPMTPKLSKQWQSEATGQRRMHSGSVIRLGAVWVSAACARGPGPSDFSHLDGLHVSSLI